MAVFYSDEFTDQSLFKSRLWRLMQEKCIDSAKSLAEKLYDGNFVTVQHKNETFDYESKIRYKAVDAISKKIQTHLHLDGPEKVQGEYFLAYCKFFGCSADYLLGFIDNPTHESTDISAATGLSDQSIRKIIDDMEEGQRLVLDDIVKSGGINEIYNAMFEWFYMTSYSGDTSIPGNMQDDVAEYVAEKYMRNVFDLLCHEKNLENHFTEPSSILESYDLSDLFGKMPHGEDLIKSMSDTLEKSMRKKKFKSNN